MEADHPENGVPIARRNTPGANVLPAKDRGRFEVRKTADADYVFRAGPLRNIELTAPYFHSGKVWDLKQAVAIMAPSLTGRTDGFGRRCPPRGGPAPPELVVCRGDSERWTDSCRWVGPD